MINFSPKRPASTEEEISELLGKGLFEPAFDLLELYYVSQNHRTKACQVLRLKILWKTLLRLFNANRIFLDEYLEELDKLLIEILNLFPTEADN